MKVFQSISDYQATGKTVVTLGTFDGVHLGHKKIISHLVQSAKTTNCESLVLTFFPHPKMAFGDTEIALLNTVEERQQLLQSAGLENLIIHPFDKAFSELSAEAFVKSVLVNRFDVSKIIVGYDHRFGNGREADINDLIAFGNKYDFEVEQIPAKEIDDLSVSSTRIRKALIEGNVKFANQLLGYYYFLTGIVVEGKKLGRTIGYPTANLKIPESYKLIPANGVYVIECIIDGATIYGMMNIGTNPTVDGGNLSIEAHFFDFDANLYNRTIKVALVHRLRSEHRFDSLEILKVQLAQDKKNALSYLKSHS